MIVVYPFSNISESLGFFDCELGMKDRRFLMILVRFVIEEGLTSL